MAQTSFFPVQCNRTIPPPNSADADFIAINDVSTERYLCKGQSRIAHLPSTEWICSSLARDIGLPVPPFFAIELTTDPGTYLFGSQWLGGGVDFTIGLPQVSNPKLFSEIFGMDWFSHNDDRHLGNYLYLVIAGDTVLRPMDFSRAWFHHGWPLPALPLSPCNTMTHKPHWEHYHGYSRPDATIDKVTALSDDWMEKACNTMPPAWIDAQRRANLISWWKSPSRQLRIDHAKITLP